VRREVLVELLLAPLRPHDLRILEVEPLHLRILISLPLNVMPPQALPHEPLNQAVIVSQANLVNVVESIRSDKLPY